MKSARDLLPSVYRTGTGIRTCDEDLALSYWDSVVGEEIAARSRPLRLVGGTLTVEVESLEWQRELRGLSFELIKKLNRALKKRLLERIEFYLPASPLPQRKPMAMAATAEGISDPMRRSLYLSSQRKSLKRGQEP